LQALGGYGFAGFYLPPPDGLVLEATRDGKDISGHLNRFLDPEKYLPLYNSGAVKKHAVVDFRSPATPHAHQAQPCIPAEELFTVLLSGDFSVAQVILP